MNLSEKYAEKKHTEQQEQEIKRQKRVVDLSNKIISTLSDKDTIEAIENYLLENGSVSVTDFGCLCQGGFCEWQKGLDGLLRPLIQEWELKGVLVRPSLKLDFHIKSAGLSHYRSKMSIEEIKKWNDSNKK